MPLLKDYFTRYGRGAIIALAVIVCAGFLVRAWVVVNPLADPGDDALAYRALAEALYKDDLSAARKAATNLGQQGPDSALGKSALAIASAKDLDAARIAFATTDA